MSNKEKQNRADELLFIERIDQGFLIYMHLIWNPDDRGQGYSIFKGSRVGSFKQFPVFLGYF